MAKTMTLEDLQKAVRDQKIIVGAKQTLRALKVGKVAKIFLAANCPDDLRKGILHYARLAKVEVEPLSQASDEVSLLCKKTFLVSVVSSSA